MKRFFKLLFVSLSCAAALLPLHTAYAEERLEASFNGNIVSDTMTVTTDSDVYTAYDNIQGITLSSSEGNTSKADIKFDIDDSIAKNIRTYRNVTINVRYYDKNYGWFKIMYDSLQDNRTYTEYVYTQNTGEWKTYSFVIDDAQFNNASLGGSDFVLTVCDELSGHTRKTMKYTPVPVTVSGVEVVLEDTTRRVTADVENNGMGNIFFTGETPQIMVNFTNRGSAEESVTAVYNVTDEEGEIVTRGSMAVALSSRETVKKAFNFPVDKYGLYRFNLEISGTDIYDRTRTGFSYNILNNTQNGPIGFTAGYTWEAYTLPLWKKAGFQNVRTRRTAWVDHVSWDSEGQLVDKNVETMVSEAKLLKENGFDVFACLTGVPAYWQNTEKGYNKVVTDEDGYKAFAEFAGFVAGHLKGYVKAVELVNEPDLENGGMTDETALHYANMVKHGYDAVKNADENIKVGIISSSNAWLQNRRTWADKVLSHLEGGRYFDYLTMHPYAFYSYPHVPENRNMPTNFNAWRSLLDEHSMKYNDSFHFTELGYHTSYAEPRPNEIYSNGSDTATEEQARNRQIRHFAIMLGDNINNEINVFDWADAGLDRLEKEDNFGMLHSLNYNNPLEAKPVFTAICAYNKITSNATACEELKGTHGNNSTGKNFVYKYTLSDRIVYMLWNSEGVGSEKLSDYVDTDRQLVFYDIYGNKLDKSDIINTDGVCTLTEEPFYVVDFFNNMQNFPGGEVELDISAGENNRTSVAVFKKGTELDENWWKNLEYLDQYDSKGDFTLDFNVGESGNIYEVRVSGEMYPVYFTAYSPEIEEINIYRNDELTESGIKPGDNITVMAKLPKNKSGEEYALICAYYKDGVLAGIERNEERAVNEIGFIDHQFILTEDKEYNEIKIMLWDSVSGMIPLRNYRSYTIGG